MERIALLVGVRRKRGEGQPGRVESTDGTGQHTLPLPTLTREILACDVAENLNDDNGNKDERRHSLRERAVELIVHRDPEPDRGTPDTQKKEMYIRRIQFWKYPRQPSSGSRPRSSSALLALVISE